MHIITMLMLTSFLMRPGVWTDNTKRKQSYDAALATLQDEMPIIYLYHQVWIWALTKNIKGFTGYPDGMIRLQGVSF